MGHKLFITLFLFCLSNSMFSQAPELSSNSYISVITCGSGEELYTSFGHSALRVQDAALGIDVVYNYGTFDFNTPNFYMKFCRGQLPYNLSRSKFENFLYSYELEKRWVTEQVLNLNLEEKNNLFSFLEHNYLPENRAYKYEFFFDNCSTRERDIIEKVLTDKVTFKTDHLKNNYTFRNLLHQNLTTNTWAAFGIDLALGSVIDKQATIREHMFLPIYLKKQLNNTTHNKKPLVIKERTILEFDERDKSSSIISSPLFCLSLILLFVIGITYIDYKNNVRSRWLDFSLFFITGILGLVIVFLWFFTDHSATVVNFNILWAFAPNLFIAFISLRKKKLPNWFGKYLWLLYSLLALCILLWIIGIQIFSPLISILIVALTIRFLFLHQVFKKGKLI